MTDQLKNDLFYVCSLIEYLGRKTLNTRKAVVDQIGEAGLRKLLKDAAVNHCLSYEQVSDETIEQYQIKNGTYDTITNCKYPIPGFQDIGRLYAYLIETVKQDDDVLKSLMAVFRSFISNEISDFKTGIYYENLSYLSEAYRAGHLLAFD